MGKLIVGIVLVALVALVSMAFVVDEREVAIKLRLGEIVETEYDPGVHFRIPLINSVIKFDRRIQTLDSRPQEFLTIEKKFVVVDSFVKWRILQVEKFYRTTRGDMRRAAELLGERINTALRDEFAKRTIQEVISGERAEIMELLAKSASEDASDLGVEIIDVRVKKVDFPPQLSEAIYRRMRTERERAAKELRAQGAEAAERIRAEAERERTELLAEAYRDAEKIRGEGDAKSAEIYATAFEQDAEFYAFWRSLSSYRTIFEQGGDVMLLNPESEFFRYLNQQSQ
ncbi:protease modulator HflC [Solemya velum gill symbiont]|uniref:Protein HflC n=2 Tax=Solemya velum gill symbiont TaxID=2340 RepID=A0A0B0H7J3_SOVGS|nr:protease modulator HflC [Solemya velum gill symbiont]KHF26168.1 protease FtsH, subunit HflC [Solemya velum gill symbiont]OOY52910.1 HflC protein [Solemya velum gill symbiont]OOY56861.1 HflC protein [Solemya velum gill symbiont]OOY58028.1 HflC protein [Solemya velum gill symbiont]OOY60870.1 HflC protein [Solemya velum gill symbiont]